MKYLLNGTRFLKQFSSKNKQEKLIFKVLEIDLFFIKKLNPKFSTFKTYEKINILIEIFASFLLVKTAFKNLVPLKRYFKNSLDYQRPKS